MIQFIFVVFGLVAFIDQLFYKWGWYQAASMWATFTIQNKFIKEMVECPLCYRTHLSVIVTAIAGALVGYDGYMFVVPFVVSGLLTFKRY